MPQYRPDDPTNGWIIPQAFKAFLTPHQADRLIGVLDPKPTKPQADAFRQLTKGPTCFVSQHDFFCYVINTVGYTDVTPSPTDQNRQRMIDALLASNALWYPLRYPAEYAGGGTINSVIQAAIRSVDAAGLDIAHNDIADCGNNGIQVWRSEAGEDGSVLFITARTSVYRLQTKTRGALLA